MNRIGLISKKPVNRLRWMMGALFAWLLLVLGLGVWWQSLLLNQANRIVVLESLLNPNDSAGARTLARTQNMLFWESTTFLVLLAGISLVIVVFHLREQLRARSLEAFFAGVTHELRTPLTSIRLQAESLNDSLESPQGPGDAGSKVVIERLMQDTLRLETQVERVLELARVEGGGQVYLQPLALGPWLKRSLSILSETYGERVQVEFGESPKATAQVWDESAVWVDPSSLQIVLRNLIENSVRHSGKTSVKITVLLERSGTGYVELSFHDDGVTEPETSSIPASELGGLFAKGSRSQGAGVGLYLVRALMERMDGKAEFHRGLSEGFTVKLTLREAGQE